MEEDTVFLFCLVFAAANLSYIYSYKKHETQEEKEAEDGHKMLDIMLRNIWLFFFENWRNRQRSRQRRRDAREAAVHMKEGSIF